MAQAATPYLARAARQPVSWQPWSRDAFALAARLDRPVLLYVGADDCRWCTVMDREVYTDPALGALIDSLFVPIRVDRDERPDIAQRYQAAVLSLAGLKGYPLTVFLTPDGAAFFGGTYFPADDPVTGRGLKQLLPDIAKGFREQREALIRHGAVVRQLALNKSLGGHGVLQPASLAFEVGNVRAGLEVALEAGRPLGGFASTQGAVLLLQEYAQHRDTLALGVARRVLDALVDSGAAAPATLDEPAENLQAALTRGLALAWVFTLEPRYREAGRTLLTNLTRTLERSADRAVFADREGYAIAAAIESANDLRDSMALQRAVTALDALLRRVYARGHGVRHAPSGSLTDLLQDQVQVAGACLAAYTATGRDRYLAIGRDLAAIMERDFADPEGGYFDLAVRDASDPPADRTKPVFDDLLPGANAWAARLLLQLAAATGDASYRRRADATLEAFAGAIQGEGPRSASFLLVARAALATTH
jgi:uncharacterized protein YyaL (SSP411 family)